MLVKAMQAGLVPMLHGSPAIGKSAIVRQIAETYNLLLIDLRLGQCDITDLLGFPYSNDMTGKSGYRPMDTFPIKGDPFPINPSTGKPYDGWLLFLDEITGANRDVQGAAYKLVLDRMVGIHHLHEKCAIIAAGNLATDNAVVNEMSTALQSRMTHILVELSKDTWMNWAIDAGITQQIRDFINFRPEMLYTFRPDHTDLTYGAPRTWEFTDKLIKILGFNDPDLLPLVAGTISHGVASEFLEFCKIYKDLPTLAEVFADPDTARVPTEISSSFAMIGTVASALTVDNASVLARYIRRMSPEFQTVAFRDAVQRDRKLIQTAEIRQWAVDHGQEYL